MGPSQPRTQHSNPGKDGDEREYQLTAIAQKRGMAVFLCSATADGGIPDYPTRRKIEQEVAQSVHEHLIIYTDTEQTTQIWQWVKREQGKPLARREHRYDHGQSGESLIQKLQRITFDIDEEEGSHTGGGYRARSGGL